MPSHSRRDCDAATREHADDHGNGFLLATHGEKAVGAPEELPQDEGLPQTTPDSESIDSREQYSNRCDRSPPEPTKMNEYQRHYEHFIEDREFGDRAVPSRGENGRSHRRAQPRAAAPCDTAWTSLLQVTSWGAPKTHATNFRIFVCSRDLSLLVVRVASTWIHWNSFAVHSCSLSRAHFIPQRTSVMLNRARSPSPEVHFVCRCAVLRVFCIARSFVQYCR